MPHKDPVARKKYKQKYAAENSARIVAQQRANKLAKFGLTEAQYEALAADGCMICGQNEPVMGRRLAVDHDHATGKFRGILCSVCNTRLGWFERRKGKIEEYLWQTR